MVIHINIRKRVSSHHFIKILGTAPRRNIVKKFVLIVIPKSYIKLFVNIVAFVQMYDIHNVTAKTCQQYICIIFIYQQ